MDKIQNPQISYPTLKEDLRGMDLREEERIWKEIANSEARLAMMNKMIQQNLAFADLEEFGSELSSKMKAIKTKNKTLHRNVTKPAMKAKLADEQMWRRDLGRVKAQLRKELIEVGRREDKEVQESYQPSEPDSQGE